jgi:hypothetical protein
MEILNFAFKIAVVISPIFFIMLLVKINHLIFLTNQNKVAAMASLQDFKDQAGRIETATNNISTFVQGTGMSAVDQEEALKTVREATDKLVAAVPTPPAQ